jgi:exosortase A
MWSSPSYSHCFLIIPLTLCLIWLQRGRLLLLRPDPNWWALAALGILCFVWVGGALAEVLVAQRLALVGMAVSLLWAVLGSKAVWELRFPLGFLFFIVPVGDSLIPHLQDLTAWLAVQALQFFSVPVLLEGRIITVRSGTWEVAGACSGIRFLTTSLVVAVLYAGVMLRTWTRRILLALVGLLVPLMANGLRVFGIVILGEHTGDAASAYFHHVTYGWLFFFIVTLVLLGIGSLLRRSEGSRLPAASAMDNAPAYSYYSVGSIVFTASAALLLLAIGPISMAFADKSTSSPTFLPAVSLTVISPWRSVNQAPAQWSPQFVGTSSVLHEAYISDAQRVEVYIAYYGPRDGTKLASSGNLLYLDPPWQRISDAVSIVAINAHAVEVHETVVRSPQTFCLIWSWYWVGGEFVESDYRAKYLLARCRLFADHRGSAAVAIASYFSFERSTAETTLRDFLGSATFFGHSSDPRN